MVSELARHKSDGMRDYTSPRSAAAFRPPSPEVEADIVRRFKRGEESALDEMLKLYWNGLLRFALRILDDGDFAEDLVQEAFVRLWNHRTKWERDDTLRPVLYRIVRNQALNEKRRRSTFRRRSPTLRRPDIDPAPSPLQEAEDQEMQAIIRKAIDSLPERRREIFLLVRYHQLSYKEAGEALGLSPQTVANQMSQAMRDLRRLLEPHMPQSEPQDIPFPRVGTV